MHDNDQIRNNRIEHIYRLVDATAKSLDKIKAMLKNLDRDDQRKSFVDVEGVTGIFDGINMVTSDGKKFEVPVNYAAKSRMVVGDSLKMVEDEGKTVFKQIDKVDRKKVEGIMTKKEGKWYIISDSGTYKVSDIAADFQHASLHDEASAFVPAKNLNVGFAALDAVKNKNSVHTPNTEANNVQHMTPAPSAASNVPVIKPATEVRKPVSRPVHTQSQAPKAVNNTPKAAEKPQQTTRSTETRTSSSTQSAPRRSPVNNSRPSGDNRGRFEAKPNPRPFKPAAKKEYVEDIVNPIQEAPTQTTPVNLEDDDLR